jgi:glutaredoxin 3
MTRISVYTTPTCPYCQSLKRLLTELGLDYEERDVSADPKAARDLILRSGQVGVPVLEVDGDDMVVGFNRQGIISLLRRKGLIP